MNFHYKDPIHQQRATIASCNVSRGRTTVHHGHGNPTSSNRIYDADEYEFLKAMETYIITSGRRFPTWSEALQVLKSLGYSRLFGSESPWMPTRPDFWAEQHKREISHIKTTRKSVR